MKPLPKRLRCPQCGATPVRDVEVQVTMPAHWTSDLNNAGSLRAAVRSKESQVQVLATGNRRCEACGWEE